MKKLGVFLFGIMAFAILLGINKNDVQASSRVTEIACTEYFSVTEKSGNDKIEIQVVADKGPEFYYYGYERIYRYNVLVNGEKMWSEETSPGVYDISMQPMSVDHKDVFIEVRCGGGSLSDVDWLQYKNGKMRKVEDFPRNAYIEIVDMNSKKIVMDVYGQPVATGSLKYRVVFKKKKNGNWVKTSQISKVTETSLGNGKNKFTSAKKIKLYKKSSCKGKKYTLKKGKTFKLLKIKWVRDKKDPHGGTFYGYFKCDKKKGWMNLDNNKAYDIFKNIMLAG